MHRVKSHLKGPKVYWSLDFNERYIQSTLHCPKGVLSNSYISLVKVYATQYL